VKRLPVYIGFQSERVRLTWEIGNAPRCSARGSGDTNLTFSSLNPALGLANVSLVNPKALLTGLMTGSILEYEQF